MSIEPEARQPRTPASGERYWHEGMRQLVEIVGPATAPGGGHIRDEVVVTILAADGRATVRLCSLRPLSNR